MVNDDIEKRVHVNKDGSLSVEMKVRFRLLNDETLQWSTQIKKSNLMNQMPCEESGVEDSGVDPIQKMNPEASSEADESLYPCDIDSYMSKLEESECDEAHCHSCGKKHQDYDIWKNPMHTSQREEPSVQSTWHTRSSCSSTSSRRRVVHKKMSSVDSLHTTSSEEFSEHIVQESSSYSETIENRVAYRSMKKCRCRSDLSTGASNGEDQQEYTRTSTSNSQRPSSLGLMSHSSCENNLDTQDAPEDHEASKTNSQNEDENCFEVSSVKCLKDDVEELESSRVGSVMSRSSLQSRRSKKNVCEETSSVGRTVSSSSLQKANQEDNTRCSTPANSVHSKSSNCTAPRAMPEQDDHSDDNAVVSSFSSESCPKKEAEEVEEEQEETEISEVSLVSAKTKPSQPIRDESSESERCSTQGTPYSRASDRKSKRSDSDEMVQCNASCSSRGSKKSKHSHIHLDAQSEMSVSSLGSTPNKKKNSLHADDLRSCSRASNYSKSSCEIKKKSIGDLMSHNSGSFHSNISSTSEAEAIAGFTDEKSLKSTTNAYSESSKGSKKRSHREENSKPSSLCSSVSSPSGKAREGHAKLNSEAPSSRHGSMSESVCSKGDLSTETGIRNRNPASVSSRVSSGSEEKDKCLLTQTSQESDDRCSQSNISQSSKSRHMKAKHLRVKMSNSSRASLSDTLSVCSMHCPAPPKGKPNSKKIRSTMLKNSSVSSIGTESVLGTGKEQKEIIDSSKATSYGSKSAATEINDQKNKEIDDSCNRKVDEDLEGTDMKEEGRDLMPSTLPNTSPEEVVQEWLSKIPSETLLMKYELEDGAEEECIEAATEISYCTNAEEISEDEKAEKKNVEEAENESKDEVGKEAAEDTAVNEEAEECMNQEHIFEAVSEAAKADQAECSQSVASSQNNNRKDLPTSVQTSVQIMKALLSSKHETKFDRSNSLPEVSPTMGRKLSNSANILITCLASLQLLDEESEDPSDKSKRLSKPRYMELLNIFQALWFGCTAEKSGPSSGQEANEQAKTASGFKAPKSVDYDFTPMSSSGVDVSSGSGGSGEEITAGARDCTLMAQKTAGLKSSGQVGNVEAGTELTEAEEQSKEEVQSSRPSTARSKAKVEEKAQSTREESLIRKAEENKEGQCSNRENGQEEKGENENGENENEENSKLVENGEQEEAEAVKGELPKENLKDKANQLATTNDTNVNGADCGTELRADLEEQLEKVSPNDPKPYVNKATSVGTSLVQQNSMDPDPIWVLRLLKKIEKEFMAHYVSAMNEFKVRWNLQNDQQMDEMIMELKEEVSKRIQKSIEKELRKIKTRAGKKTPRPPDEPLKRESTLQTEQRRRRLQTMHKKSLFSDKNGTQSRLEDTTDLSFDVDEDTVFSAAFEASISKQTSEEEYCPCDSCVRKKMASKPVRNPVVATNAPVMKAFDLQQILRLKKNNEEACVSEAAQDINTIPSSSVEEAAENGNPNEENGEGELQPRETEVEGNEEKEPELNKVDSSMLKRDGEGPEISESQNCEIEDEVKDEEMKEEEKEEAEEVGEEMKEREEEDEEAKEEEEEKEEEEIMKAKEEETKEKTEGETEEKEDEEVKEEETEETKEEEKEEEEEEVKEEEQETKKEEGETKEEEEEVDEKEEETKEEEENMEKEYAKEEEEEVKEEEEETKEEEEDMKDEEEGTKDKEEDMKEEEETKEEEEEVQEEEELTKEDEEAKEDEEETKQEEQEVEEEEEKPKEEEEEAKEEKERAKYEEETKEEEEEANKEEEEHEEEETQNEEQEADEQSEAEDEADNEAEEAEEPEDEDIGADDEEETSECRGNAGTDNNPEEDAAEGSEEAEQDEAVAVEDAKPESEGEACSDEEENDSEGRDKYDENDEEPTSDDLDKEHDKHKDKGKNKFSEKPSKVKRKKPSKKLEALNKAAAFSCYSSVGNFSQQSQKGSEDEGEECKDDNNPMNNHPNGDVQSSDSSKPSQMYPDSEEEEEDKASSCTDPLGDEDQADAEGADPKENKHTDEVQASKKKDDSDEIDQDDLDF